MRIVLATANPDKASEISAVLSGLELVPRPADVGEVEETEPTLEGNARLKAHALRDATGMPALADDTGLEVAALGGAPGVVSARWSGPDATYASNVAKLLREMEGVADRRARFRTVVHLAFPDGRDLVAEGAVDGVITTSGRGSNGFGYDPVFQPDEAAGRTLAELTLAEKNALSHRARALRALTALLAGA
ncbi:MAG TPA: RdgB/HAM1 family non-canonical purine NTP pyrophosphatase [Acidimicrobiales bacterium]|nr:RdgB/HAM1 family non-canonical purine NTP pyrophosphatase [Acidimicrobiales bacterium]